ncbi:hypothetical protein [Streptomyces ambofaciens]
MAFAPDSRVVAAGAEDGTPGARGRNLSASAATVHA